MKNKCKFLFILIFIIASLFYRADFIVAMAAEETTISAAETETEPESGSESVVEPEAELEPIMEPEAEPEPVVEPEVEPEPIMEPETEPELLTEPEIEPEPVAACETGQELIMTSEPVMQFTINSEPAESVSTGPALIEWLESHKNSGGTVKLSDNVVLDGYYSFCPNGRNMPSVFVDTDKYTITVKGEVELLSDNHLIFSGEPDGKSIFYVAPKGMLSMEGITVEGGQCAMWQEEGAGLVAANCSISGSIHYAEMPFVLYYNNSICAVVEKGQTLNEALPTQISCTVNRQGRLSSNEWVPVSWNLEGTERQQEERRRFAVQGSFFNAASTEPVQCTVVYNDAPLTFTDVKASVNGSLYTFQGGFTVPEESLPFTVMAEYSFDGENWFLYEEQGVKNPNAGFYIACKLEAVSRTAHSNIYIRLQWNDNGIRYFSNVLCYAANDIESAEDIGGSRGGGTSIINPPETPQENDGEVPQVKEEPGHDADLSDKGHPSDTESVTISAEPITADAEQLQNVESESADAKQPIKSEPVTADAGKPQNVESESADAKQPIKSEPVNTDTEQSLSVKAQDGDAKLPLYAGKDVNPSEVNEQTLRPDSRRNHHFVITAGAAALSVIVGAVGFCVHSLSGTKR